MPEPYVVRINPDGTKKKFMTKRDYEYGKLSSFGNASKKAKKFGA